MKNSHLMKKEKKDLSTDLDLLRKNFPILDKCIYLISNSLGAVPKRVGEDLNRYFTSWATEGVSAWEKEWWSLSRSVGDKVSSIIGAGPDEVTMMTNATQSHWIALSTKFDAETTLDFPSILYSVSQICSFMDWRFEVVESRGEAGIDLERILNKVAEGDFALYAPKEDKKRGGAVSLGIPHAFSNILLSSQHVLGNDSVQ